MVRAEVTKGKANPWGGIPNPWNLQGYLDYAATAPVRPEVLDCLLRVLTQDWGNPASLHGWGERAAVVMETARWQVAECLGVTPEWVVFTSGGTESNHLAIHGICQGYRDPQHLIVSAGEHAAVQQVALHWQALGWQVTFLPLDPEGFVRVADLEAALQANTVLVSLIHGHNEVGSLQPIRELAQVCRARGIPFHTDGVQSVGKVPLHLQELGVDLLSLSGHKLGAPQGIGALLIRPGIPLQPWLRGGGQEQGLRSGTQAVGLIAALGEACRLAHQEMASSPHRLWQADLATALAKFPQMHLTGSRDFSRRLPQHLSYVVAGWSSSELVRRLAEMGLGISGGSACLRGKPQPNRILQAMGYDAEQALSGIRISWGWGTTWEDLARIPKALGEILGVIQ